MRQSSSLLHIAVMTAMLSFAMGAIAQTQADAPAAPVPPQILNAKKIFIANMGPESVYLKDGLNHYVGDPNRTYNEFYAAMKAWPQVELVSSPAEADVVYEIHFEDRTAPGIGTLSILTQIRLLIVDPKSHTTLWALTEYVGPGGRAKNREKNFDTAMNELVANVKNLVSPATPNPK